MRFAARPQERPARQNGKCAERSMLGAINRLSAAGALSFEGLRHQRETFGSETLDHEICVLSLTTSQGSRRSCNCFVLSSSLTGTSA